jgi:hypothetical protein
MFNLNRAKLDRVVLVTSRAYFASKVDSSCIGIKADHQKYCLGRVKLNYVALDFGDTLFEVYLTKFYNSHIENSSA